MTLTYTLDNSLNDFSDILSQYMDWYREVSKILCFPEDLSDRQIPEIPKKFESWIKVLEEQDYIFKEDLARIKGLYGQLDKMSSAMIFQIRSTKKQISADQYQGIHVIFNEFMKIIQDVDRKSRIHNLGFDVLTGLRTVKAMHIDLQRELEKMERQGIPFSVAMVKIDSYADLVREEGDQTARIYQKLVAETILEAMRAYDDAYRLHNGEFLLCMKQSDLHGAVAALQRLYGLIAEKEIMITLKGESKKLTISSCIAEPLPEDNVDILLDYLRDDLKSVDEGSGALTAYAEISPVERYANAVIQDLNTGASS